MNGGSRQAGGGRAATIVLAVGLALLAAVIGARTLSEYDLPWHLATGREIVQLGAIPTVDDFSYVGDRLRYVSPVSDLALYGLHQLGGPLALQLFGAAIAVLLAAVLATRAGAQGPAGLALVALALVAIHPWLIVRPATVSFLFAAVVLALVDRHRRGPATRGGRLALAAAPPLAWLWANCHGGAIVAVLVLLLYAGQRTLATLARGRWPNLLPPSDAGALPAAWAAAVAAPLLVLLNPAGLGYFGGVGAVGPYVALISEWQPTTLAYLTSAVPVAGAFLVVAALALLLGREPSGSRVPPLDTLALVAAAALLTTVVRFVPLAIVVLVPIAARRVGHLVPDTARARALLAATVAIAALAIATTDRSTRGVGWEPKNLPVAAAEFVAASDLAGPMWNFWPYGGYLTWRLYPRHRVALDGRFGLVTYPMDHVLAAVAAGERRDAWATYAQRHAVEWAFCYGRADVVRACRPVADDPAWTMIYWDEMAAIYVRRAGPNRALATAGYRALRHVARPEAVLDLALRGERLADLSHDGALARAQAPRSTRALFYDAVGALAADDERRFFAALDTLGEIAPYHPAIPTLAALVPRMRARAAPAAPP